jgi:uncharacterized protein (DUF697 family)
MFWLLAYIGICSLVGWFGSERRFGFWGYLVCSFIFTPIVGLLLIIGSGKSKSPSEVNRIVRELDELGSHVARYQLTGLAPKETAELVNRITSLLRSLPCTTTTYCAHRHRTIYNRLLLAGPETTYEERVGQLNVLKRKAADAQRQAAELEKELQRDRKVALGYRKDLTRHPTCEKIINRYVLMSAGVGLLLPFPGIDVAALTGLQIKMIDDLAEQFGRNYTEAEARHTLTALTGGLAGPLAAPALASAAVVVPLVGPLVSLTARPGTAAASTHMVGHLALEYLEKEGTPGGLDPNKPPETVGGETVQPTPA